MTKEETVHFILKAAPSTPMKASGSFFAPSNIALCKYWGKRDLILNLPSTGSLSISLGAFGARTTLSLLEGGTDRVFLNGKAVEAESAFFKKLSHFLDLFRTPKEVAFKVETEVNIPVGAGLASSACGFAALVGALDRLFGWDLPKQSLSLLARLGSGSACRSFWEGFVEWEKGERADGLDSFARPIPLTWPSLRIGLLILHSEEKALSSREAMLRTVMTSPFYSVWPSLHQSHLERIRQSLETQDFEQLGKTSEANALAMHALMSTACPSIVYTSPSTLAAMQVLWRLRQEGMPVFFTQDAGPNLKLLFLEGQERSLLKQFPALKITAPFQDRNLIC